MNTADIIFLKFKEHCENGNIKMQDDSDGNGPYIKHWAVPNSSEPDLQTIQQWIDEEGDQLLLNERIKNFTEYLQKMIDTKAQEKGYNDGNSCVSYKNSTIQQWADEAEAFLIWRDQVWAYAINTLNTNPTITDQAFLSGLPSFNWGG